MKIRGHKENRWKAEENKNARDKDDVTQAEAKRQKWGNVCKVELCSFEYRYK